MSIRKCRPLLTSLSRLFCSKTHTTTQVSILGSNCPIGRFLGMQLKQCPLISKIHLHGVNAEYMAMDLNFIDTRCQVTPYTYDEDMCKAVRCADIVVILGDAPKYPYKSLTELVMEEGDRILECAKVCTEYAPKSIIVVACTPVSVFLPMVESVYKTSDWYHPGRIVGSAGYAEVKANCITAEHISMDPQICSVPIIGGPDIDLAVPLFSRAQPAAVPTADFPKLFADFRCVPRSYFPRIMSREDYFDMNVVAEATGLCRLVQRIALGLCGDQQSCSCAYVRSNLLPTTLHLVTTLQFGPNGVQHNFGVPELTNLELRLLTKSLQDIKARENMAVEYLDYLEGERGPEGPPFLIKEQLMEHAKNKKIVTEFMMDE